VSPDKEIRVAIVGVGNCANSLVQGVHYYRDAARDQEIPGLMNVVIGGYHVGDVKFVAAFDVDKKKVGLDLADAIWASENNTIKFSDVPQSGIKVLRGVTHDGLGRYYRETITESDSPAVDVVKELKDAKVDVLVCYLPVGSDVATKFYAQCALMQDAALLMPFQSLSPQPLSGRINSQRLAFQLLAMILNLKLEQLLPIEF